MTIASQISRVIYVGNAATKVFPVPFKFTLETDLVVYLTDSLGTETLQGLGTDYSVSGAGVDAGGSVTFAAAPGNGVSVVIYRDPPVTQTTSYNNNDPFPAKSHENALDKLTMLIQRVYDRLTKTISLHDGSTYSDLRIDDPVAGEYLLWGADGAHIESTAIITPAGSYPIATQSQAEAGTLNNVLMTPLRTAEAITARTNAVSAAIGEVGVVDTSYPIGDVRRYGIKLDAFKATATTNGTNIVTGAAGTFSAASVGMTVIDTTSTSSNFIPALTLVTAVAGDGSSITMSAAATGSGSRTLMLGTDAFANLSVYQAIRDNGKNPHINLYFPRGLIISGFNFGWDYSGTPASPWKAHFDHTTICSIVHIINALSNWEITGTLYIRDRFGITAGNTANGSITNGSAVISAAAGTFSAWPVGSTVINAAIRTGRGIIQSVATDGSSITLDNPGISTAAGTSLANRSTNIRVENVIMVHDVGGNAATPGMGGRGCHIVEVCGFYFKRMTVIDCEGTSTDGVSVLGSGAAFWFEQSFNGRDIIGGDLLVVNSGTHGVVVNGFGWNVDNITVRGSVRSAIDFQPGGGSAGFPNEAESEKGVGIMFGRWSGHIRNVWVGQSNWTPSGSYRHAIRFDDTGSTAATDTTYRAGTLGNVYVEAGTGASGENGDGVQIGVSGFTANMNLAIDVLTIQLNAGWNLLSSSEPLLYIPDTVGGAVHHIKIGLLRFNNPQGMCCLRTACAISETKSLDIGAIEINGSATAGNYLDVEGVTGGDLEVTINRISAQYSGASYATKSLLYFYKLTRLSLRNVEFVSASGIGSSLLDVESSNDIEIANVRSINVRGVNPVGAIRLGDNNKLDLHNVDLVSDTTAAGSTGIYFLGGNGDYVFNCIRVTSFALGTDKAGGATFARNACANSLAFTCTTASNLAGADFVAATKLNQNLVS